MRWAGRVFVDIVFRKLREQLKKILNSME